MIANLILVCLSLAVHDSPPNRLLESASTQNPPAGKPADHKVEYEKRRAEAEGDAKKLWALYDWCDVSGLQNEAKSCLRAIVKLDDGDKKAHELLGHVWFEGKWFDSEKKLEEHKLKQLEAEAKASGKAVFNGELVDPADMPFLKLGLVKTVDGKWLSVEDKKKMDEGWARQDLEWIPPAEIPQREKGLFKCGENWLTVEEADRYHSDVGRWWKLPSDHFVLYSTCPRKVSEFARNQIEMAYRELSRAYGKTPETPVPVLVLNSADQYGLFAAGDAGIPVPEARGLSSVHGACFADTWLEPAQSGMTGAGVAYWDSTNEAGNKFGEMFARHAAGQSFAEALDPSPKAMAKFLKGQVGQNAGDEFWAEKLIPQWFRYGAAAYVERYMVDSTVGVKGDPNWRRAWSVGNIAGKGGLDPLDKLFECRLTVEDPTGSAKMINECGLLVAFVLDGKCTPVVNKHAAFKDALRNGKDVPKAAQALAEEIKKNEDKLRTFAGL